MRFYRDVRSHIPQPNDCGAQTWTVAYFGGAMQLTCKLRRGHCGRHDAGYPYERWRTVDTETSSQVLDRQLLKRQR